MHPPEAEQVVIEVHSDNPFSETPPIETYSLRKSQINSLVRKLAEWENTPQPEYVVHDLLTEINMKYISEQTWYKRKEK